MSNSGKTCQEQAKVHLCDIGCGSAAAYSVLCLITAAFTVVVLRQRESNKSIVCYLVMVAYKYIFHMLFVPKM